MTSGTRPSLLIQLSELRKEVRTLHQSLRAEARRYGKPGSDDYFRTTARVLDHWIRSSQDRKQMVCMACAAEMRVLQVQHLALCYRNSTRLSDPAISALFWTIARRFRTSEAAMRGTLSAGALPSRSESVSGLCADCLALRHNFRHAPPHPALHRAIHGEIEDSAVACRNSAWFRCSACGARWLWQFAPHAPFGIWSFATVPFKHTPIT